MNAPCLDGIQLVMWLEAGAMVLLSRDKLFSGTRRYIDSQAFIELFTLNDNTIFYRDLWTQHNLIPPKRFNRFNKSDDVFKRRKIDVIGRCQQ